MKIRIHATRVQTSIAGNLLLLFVVHTKHASNTLESFISTGINPHCHTTLHWPHLVLLGGEVILACYLQVTVAMEDLGELKSGHLLQQPW